MLKRQLPPTQWIAAQHTLPNIHDLTAKKQLNYLLMSISAIIRARKILLPKGDQAVSLSSRQALKRPSQRAPSRSLLPLMISLALMHGNLLAQDECVEIEGTPPGLYTTTDEGTTFIIKEDKVVELSPGQSGYASDTAVTCIKAPPEFLDWPCSSDAAKSRKFATYRVDELEGDNIIKQVVTRYFEVPEVIEPIPNWVDGEYSTRLNFSDIVPFSSPDYWYRANPAVDIMHEKRPKTLLISLFVGINKVVIDNFTIDALNSLFGGKDIPVVFIFNDSNVVPVSYFGENVSMEEIFKAFVERKIKLAEVPMWPLGDYHLAPTAQEFEQFVELPDFEDIDPLRREALQAELEVFGFSKKPIFVTMLDGGAKLYVDDPERVRVAIHMNMQRLNTVINFVEADDHLRRCGPGTPVGSGGVSGATTPIGGPTLPPGVTPPPDPEPPPPASES